MHDRSDKFTAPHPHVGIPPRGPQPPVWARGDLRNTAPHGVARVLGGIRRDRMQRGRGATPKTGIHRTQWPAIPDYLRRRSHVSEKGTHRYEHSYHEKTGFVRIPRRAARDGVPENAICDGHDDRHTDRTPTTQIGVRLDEEERDQDDTKKENPIPIRWNIRGLPRALITHNGHSFPYASGFVVTSRGLRPITDDEDKLDKFWWHHYELGNILHQLADAPAEFHPPYVVPEVPFTVANLDDAPSEEHSSRQ